MHLENNDNKEKGHLEPLYRFRRDEPRCSVCAFMLGWWPQGDGVGWVPSAHSGDHSASH